MQERFKHPSVMAHEFSQVPEVQMQRSSFKRSHGYKTAFDAGWLIPIYVDEALPGDTFHLNLSSVARLATPIVPLMDNIKMDFFFFFVPNRLVWDHWANFCGEKASPNDSTVYSVPQVPTVAGGFLVGTLADYFGLPLGVHPLSVNALHFRAYNLIWNEWFRDQNLQDPVVVDHDEGPDTLSDYVLLKRGKRHDYFTSCLPWPQKGAGVELPLGSYAPIYPMLTDTTWNSNFHEPLKWRDSDSGNVAVGNKEVAFTATGGSYVGDAAAAVPGVYLQPANLWADLSSATAATINSLREAFQLQRMLERDARGGTRYIELLLSHFGVESPDGRLQRPEYLGGGSTDVIIAPIAQTSKTETGAPQGNLAAIGFQSNSGIGFTKSFVEHGVLLGLVSVRADLTYQNGVDRMWSRQTRYDYYWPALANLGEQEVLKKEVYAIGNAATDDQVWGYQERWAEYRYAPSKITGKLRSDAAGSLDVWHLSQDWAALPPLNAEFIVEDPPIARVIAVPTEPHFIFDGFFDVTCTRPMPMYSVPGLIDHF